MEELKKQLEEKRKVLHSLIMEIRELEEKILKNEWKDKMECELQHSEISDGLCPYGKTIRGMVYCKNINCHK